MPGRKLGDGQEIIIAFIIMTVVLLVLLPFYYIRIIPGKIREKFRKKET